MSHQIRPGSRGGRDQFNWDQVKEDKLRLNYLGSSIHGVPDKYKKGPETFWYAKEPKAVAGTGSKKEIENVKDKEKQMMEALLGGGVEKAKPRPVIYSEQRRDFSPDRRNGPNIKMRHGDEHRVYSSNDRGTRNRHDRDSRHPEVSSRHPEFSSARHGGSEVNRYERDLRSRQPDAASSRYNSGRSRRRYDDFETRNR